MFTDMGMQSLKHWRRSCAVKPVLALRTDLKDAPLQSLTDYELLGRLHQDGWKCEPFRRGGDTTLHHRSPYLMGLGYGTTPTT